MLISGASLLPQNSNALAAAHDHDSSNLNFLVLNQGYSAWSGYVRGVRLTLVNESYRLIQNFSLKVPLVTLNHLLRPMTFGGNCAQRDRSMQFWGGTRLQAKD
ncbi:unnamed protein product [Calypogeia fissa]